MHRATAPLLLSLLCAPLGGCDSKGSDTGAAARGGADGGDDDGEEPTLEYTDHCGNITTHETWTASDSPHRMTCNVDVVDGSLTIEAGAWIVARDGVQLSVGSGDQPVQLAINGTAALPVVFKSDDDEALPGAWKGLSIDENTEAATLTGLEIHHAGQVGGAALNIDVAETVAVTVQGLEISSSTACGLKIKKGGGLSDDSADVAISDTTRGPACARVDNVHTLPGPDQGGRYESEEYPWIEVSGTTLATSVTWQDLGLPYAILDTFTVERENDPAVLTLEPGVTLAFEVDQALQLSEGNHASGLVAEGTADAPITFTALGANEPGSWVGITAERGVAAEHFRLSNVTIAYAGRRKAALRVADALLLAQDITVRDSASAGIGFEGSGGFQEGSSGINSSYNAEEPLYMDARSIGTIPTDGLDLSANDISIIRVTGDNDVTASTTWKNLDLDYVVDSEVSVWGTASNPAVLTIEPGTRVLFEGQAVRLSVGEDGAGGLVLGGSDCATSTEPAVYFGPYSAAQQGAWKGIQLHWYYDDALSCVGNFEVAYAGGHGAIRVVGSASLLQHATISNGAVTGLYDGDSGDPSTCAVWTNTYATATVANVTHDHALGDEMLLCGG